MRLDLHIWTLVNYVLSPFYVTIFIWQHQIN